MLSLIADYLPTISSSVVIGCLFTLSLLAPEKSGLVVITDRYRNFVSIFALLWVASSSLLILSTLRQIIGGAFDLTTIRSFLTQVSLGRVLFIQLCISIIVAILIRRITSNGQAFGLLVLANIGIAAPLFESHSGDAGMHGLAIGSIIFHVMALTIWIGVLIAFLFADEGQWKLILPRWSAQAPWIAMVVLASGLINSWTRMNFRDAWSSEYARILLAKILLVGILLVIAAYLRNLVAKSTFTRAAGRNLIAMEVLLLALIAFVGSWLSRTEPPLRGDLISSDDLRALAITGVKFPLEPNLWRWTVLYEADGLILGALILITALYIAGVVRLARRGVKWPIGRTISFALGISAIDYATSGALGLYSFFSFSHHMAAHMVLGMIAPIGIVLGAPITLALRALPSGRNDDERGLRGLLVRVLSSRMVYIFSHPIIALAIFDGSLFALYFTPLFDLLMGSHLGHLVMSIHFLLAGILFFHVIIGIDPRPKQYPHLFRIVILFAAMSIHAFFSISLLSSTTLIGGDYYAVLATPWVNDLLADQRIGASIGWAMGEIPILLSLVATFIQWVRSDEREAARIDRASKRAKDRGEKDELDHYNDYLARLAKRDEELD